MNRRNRVLTVLSNIILHLHPVSIPQHALRIRFTWCMGGITAFLFLVEVITGILLMFYYRPTIEFAYRDILDLRDVVSLGILREIHRWAAHALVITVMLHMLRVFLTGSYKPPRELNWVVGTLLLVLTLFLSFTGYLLPWDQLSLWAVTVGSNIAGTTPLVGANGPGHELLTSGGQPLISAGSDIRYVLLGANGVGEETLNRFYVLHCIALPLTAIFLMAVHFWRIRKDGGISGPL
jgi:cytochrome b6